MSRVELILKTIGVSAVILSSYITPTSAQTIDKPPKPQNFHTSTNIKNTTSPLKISQATDTVEEEEVEQVEELDPTVEAETYSEFERLEQDPDRLNLPATPEEVEININEPLTLKQALDLALRNNKDLEESRLNLVRAERELQQARSALYPDLDLRGNFTESDSAASERSRERFGAGSSADEDSITQLDSDITLSYNVYTGGNRGADIRRAKKNVEFNQLDVERITEQTLFETARDYYDLQNSNAQVNIEEAAVEDAQQTLKDAQLLEQAGLGTRFDVLRAEVELANAEQRLTTRIAEQRTARRQLAETLSLGQQVNLETADEIQEAGLWDKSLEETIVLGYSDRAELDQLLVRKQINEEQRKIAWSAIKPQISLFAEYEILEVYDDDADLADGYSYGARLQWSIFDGGTALARARQEETDILIDQTAFANQRNQVRVEVEQAYFGLQANKENIVTSGKAVELAEESLRLARLRFQAGVGTQTDVIEAQTELTTARGNRLDAIIQYNQSLNQLYRAINGLSTLVQTFNQNSQ
ncbi:outer membrane protein [Xenococcus sp. PCC 7305]|uniref:TolC family protein n=1 Tax=Xenococcus sp. PCC 7305 TaxID=102125 RepID=UPI0002AC13AF|nr:TolC family protein [Xenococcus sp. PCC 7305]ELS00353.1 outer membrane protein [Xenococcus sp. PCC 7305]